MADLVLKDRAGTQITYNGIEVVSIPNAEGGTSHFLNLETGGIPSGGTDGQVLKKLSETDYDVGWEDAEEAEWEAFIVTELAKRGQLKPEFANSVEELVATGDTTKLYVLPDGYIYAYGEITKYIVENQFDESGAILNARIRGTGAIETGRNGMLVTNEITVSEVVNPYTIIISGITIQYSSGYNYYVYAVFYDSTDTKVGDKIFSTLSPNEQGQYVIDIYDGTLSTASYVRLSLCISTSALSSADIANLHIDFVPKDEVQTIKEWGSTGHAFIPADYEDRIIDLEDKATELEHRIIDIEENGLTGDIIPEYWESAVSTAIEKIKAKQNLAGHNCVNFIMFSDMHIIHGSNNYAHNVGKLSRYIMDKCDIPLTCFLGDWVDSNGEDTKEKMLDDVRVAKEILSPISSEELCTITGNHDLWFDGNTHTVSMEERYNALCRHNTKDFHKVFGEDGNYYYLDNVPQKTRFIFLDGNWAEWTVDENNSPSYNSFAQGGYGQDQLQFLADSLKVQSGWCVCIFTHVPPIDEYRPPTTAYDYFRDGDVLIGIINAYINKTTYSGSYTGKDYNGLVRDWAVVNISVDYTNDNGELIAMFTGHRHLDEVFTDTLDCPIVTITTCSGQKLKDRHARTYGTDTETALDIVTINKATRTIYCTRVGVGSDRQVNY
jgi:hypothetical protein